MGSTRVVRGACPHDCPSTCALEVERLSPTQIGRVHGAKANPYTAGVICAKVARYAERQHHPERLAQPMRRVGDKGVGFQAEVRVGSLAPASQDSFAFQPYVFLDQAWIWNNDRPIFRNYPNGEDLTSAGIGMRAAYGSHGRVDVTLAKPLRAAGLQTEKGDVRLLVSLTTKLVPS